MKIKDLLPLEREGPGRPIEIDMREAVNAIFYSLKTGCQWENLPHDFPNYQSVFYHYNKWCKDGTGDQVNRALRYDVRAQAGRCPHPSAAIIDSQSVKTTEVGGERGYAAGKKVKGRKRHLLVDTMGNLLSILVLPANIQDRDGAQQLLERIPLLLRLRLQKIWADSADTGDLLTGCYEQFQMVLEIVARPPGEKGFVRLTRRWVVARSFAWLANYRRLRKDYEANTRSSEGMIDLASIHRMLRRLAT